MVVSKKSIANCLKRISDRMSVHVHPHACRMLNHISQSRRKTNQTGLGAYTMDWPEVLRAVRRDRKRGSRLGVLRRSVER